MTKHINLKNNHLLISKVLAWQPSTKQLEQFEQLQFFLKKWNTKLNLTRLLEGNDYWIGQVIDSLWPFTNELQNSDVTKKIIDVGSGCGLPGLAIAIALPKVSLTLVDSISRKTTAIKSISEELGLNSRVSVVNERVELLGQQISYRGSYDIALARAVGTAEVVAEYLVPFLDNSGDIILNLIYDSSLKSNSIYLETHSGDLTANIPKGLSANIETIIHHTTSVKKLNSEIALDIKVENNKIIGKRIISGGMIPINFIAHQGEININEQ